MEPSGLNAKSACVIGQQGTIAKWIALRAHTHATAAESGTPI
jgi:hypothetical protein